MSETQDRFLDRAAGTSGADVARFYDDHRNEILARMRQPTTPTKNVAATLVARCEKNQRLRAEALDAIHVAEARAALEGALEAYALQAHSRVENDPRRGGRRAILHP